MLRRLFSNSRPSSDREEGPLAVSLEPRVLYSATPGAVPFEPPLDAGIEEMVQHELSAPSPQQIADEAILEASALEQHSQTHFEDHAALSAASVAERLSLLA